MDKSVTPVSKLWKAVFLARRILSWVHTLSYKSRLGQGFFSSGCHFTVKGKAIPLQAWTGPDSFRSLRLPDFKTIGT